jgi:hypothetical protein
MARLLPSIRTVDALGCAGQRASNSTTWKSRPRPARAIRAAACFLDALADLLEDDDEDMRTEDDEDDGVEKARTEKESIMNRTQELRDIAKTGGGVVAIAKAFLDEGRSFGIGETEFTQLMTEHAQRMFPDKTPEGAFAKLFCDNGADSVVLRKAHALTKGVYDHADLTPTMVGGPAATHAAVSDTEQSEAYAKLQDMAERMRATSPWLSSEQAFAAVFTDPKNGKLAASAHRRPVATTSFEFPR